MTTDRFIITTAPEAYDYRTARTVIPVGVIRYLGYQCRMVRVDAAADAEYQRDRYASGMYLAMFEDDCDDDGFDTDPDFDPAAFKAWHEAKSDAPAL